MAQPAKSSELMWSVLAFVCLTGITTAVLVAILR